MTTDRWADLQRLGPAHLAITVEPPSSAPTLPATHVTAYAQIKAGLQRLREQSRRIAALREADGLAVQDAQHASHLQQLDSLMMEATQIGTAIRQHLDALRVDDGAWQADHPDSALTQMRANLYALHLRQFRQVMNVYQQEAHRFKQTLRDRNRRELTLVDPRLKPEQIDHLIDQGQSRTYVQAALISEELDDMVVAIEERHVNIQRLEEQVTEVYHLFQDLAHLVDTQQELLDSIAHHVRQAKDYTEQGARDVGTSEGYQKKNRRRLCLCLCLLMVLIGIIVGPTLWVTLKKG